jgi:hypothetical protein
MTMLIEQEAAKPVRRVVAGPDAPAKRPPIWVRADVFAQAEVSTARKIAAWVALAICLAILGFLLAGL